MTNIFVGKYCKFEDTGIFAKVDIPENETIWSLPQKEPFDSVLASHQIREKTEEQINQLTVKSLMIDEDTYFINSCQRFFNHSGCSPNLKFSQNQLKLKTNQIIKKGSELTFDLNTSETEQSLRINEKCKNCKNNCEPVSGSLYRNYPWVTKTGKENLTQYVKLKASSVSWNMPQCYVRSDIGKVGRGLFCSVEIPKGTVILIFGGKVVTYKEVVLYPEELLHLTLQVSDDLWQVPVIHGETFEVGDYINHSCSPSTVLLDSTTVIARYNIPAHTELTMDYGAANTGISELSGDNFDCLCGSNNCRTRITPKDYQLKEVQDAYWPYFPNFVKEKILKMRPELNRI